MTKKNEDWKPLFNDSVDYRQTVEALLTFAAFIVHDGVSKRRNAEFGLGRRMSTAATREIAEVTPDLVAQKNETYGVVTEAKKSLSQDQSQWLDCLAQLRKYDDTLIGWWTENEMLSHSDTVMLIHHSRSRAFVSILKERKERDEAAIGPTTSVVEFSESHESGINIFFRLEHGDIKDEELREKLQLGIPVPLDKVIQSLGHIRYYDARPPMVLLLTNLWTDYFPSLLPEADPDEETGAKHIRVTIDQTTQELQKANGSGALHQDERSTEFPKKSWIRAAFESLVHYDLALPPQDGNSGYTILYKGVRDDVLYYFANLECGISKKKVKAEKQLTFFNNKDAS